MNIAQRHNYLNKSILNLKSSVIREYDMQDAGFTIIQNNKLFDDELIEKISKLSKHAKNVTIGKLLRDHTDVSNFIMEEFIRVREKFLSLNNIEEGDILSIKKDAIFTINKSAEVLEFDGYTFKNKHKYSSYFYLNNKEFYYSSWDDLLETKGFGKDVVTASSEHFLKDIKLLMKQYEILDQERMIKAIKTYRNKYLGLELPLGCYRELNHDNGFRLKAKFAGETLFLDNLEDEKLLSEIDITYNYINYIIPLIGLIV